MAWSPRAPGHDAPWGRLGHKVERATTGLLGLASAETALELHRALDLDRRVQQRPYATVAAAAGVGYVLGGGLFSAPTRRLLGLGLRVAAVALAAEQLRLLLSHHHRGTR